MTSRKKIARLWPFLLIVLVVAVVAGAQLETRSRSSRMKAVEFPAGTRWVNTRQPVTLQSLRGRVVVMDFWTYCCINCLHALPRLSALEQAYANQPVTVLGVHSGKFDQEHHEELVREAIDKYDVRRPVAMDDDFTIWNLWGVRAWPTIVVIDSAGRVARTMTGEPEPGQLEEIVDQLLAEGRRDGTLHAGAGPATVNIAADTGALHFPGKILVDGERIFIADSGHNRLVIANKSGVIQQTFGGPDAGFTDGDARHARFHEPQGMALVGNQLYVADRNNHTIRLLDLAAQTVRTVAGTGRKAAGSGPGGPALTTDLRSPWALSWRENGLDIAMAGSHQIWRFDPRTDEIRPLAGTGMEALTDGALGDAAFAQPSGLWRAGAVLYVADSESSAVRAIDLARGVVSTLVGTGLFDFGLVDGYGVQARLQHPLDVVGAGSRLYIADSFNNRIRLLDTTDRNRVTTLAVTGVTPFKEPSGLSIDGNLLYVADTNNHRVVVIDLSTNRAKVLSLSGAAR